MFLPSNITLQFGDSGDFVAELQRRLARVSCFNEHQVSGFYDGATVTGVSSFQSRVGLHVDGVAGPETLKRLNGVISGDTGATSSDSKKDEEAAKEAAAAAQLRQNFVAADQLSAAQLLSPAAIETPQAAAEITQSAQAAPIDPLTAAAAQIPQDSPAQQALRDQQLNQQMALAQQAQTTPAPNPDLLAQMLLQTAPKPSPLATDPAPRMPDMPPPLPQPASPAPSATEQAAVGAAAAEKSAVLTEQATPERKGVVGRAMQVVNSYIEKLGAYFEAKLPPSVMNEVKAIGEVMAKSGMKESAIPGGPELPSRAQELPAKAPEPAQIPQRN